MTSSPLPDYIFFDPALKKAPILPPSTEVSDSIKRASRYFFIAPKEKLVFKRYFGRSKKKEPSTAELHLNPTLTLKLNYLPTPPDTPLTMGHIKQIDKEFDSLKKIKIVMDLSDEDFKMVHEAVSKFAKTNEERCKPVPRLYSKVLWQGITRDLVDNDHLGEVYFHADRDGYKEGQLLWPDDKDDIRYLIFCILKWEIKTNTSRKNKSVDKSLTEDTPAPKNNKRKASAEVDVDGGPASTLVPKTKKSKIKKSGTPEVEDTEHTTPANQKARGKNAKATPALSTVMEADEPGTEGKKSKVGREVKLKPITGIVENEAEAEVDAGYAIIAPLIAQQDADEKTEADDFLNSLLGPKSIVRDNECGVKMANGAVTPVVAEYSAQVEGIAESLANEDKPNDGSKAVSKKPSRSKPHKTKADEEIVPDKAEAELVKHATKPVKGKATNSKAKKSVAEDAIIADKEAVKLKTKSEATKTATEKATKKPKPTQLEIKPAAATAARLRATMELSAAESCSLMKNHVAEDIDEFSELSTTPTPGVKRQTQFREPTPADTPTFSPITPLNLGPMPCQISFSLSITDIPKAQLQTFNIPSNARFTQFWGQCLAIYADEKDREIVAKAKRVEFKVPGGASVIVPIPGHGFVASEDVPAKWAGAMRIAAAAVGKGGLYSGEKVMVALK